MYFFLQSFEIPAVEEQECDFSTNNAWTAWGECLKSTDCESHPDQLGWLYRTRSVCQGTDHEAIELEQANCAEGYTGTNCSQCDTHFERDEFNNCATFCKSFFFFSKNLLKITFQPVPRAGLNIT